MSSKEERDADVPAGDVKGDPDYVTKGAENSTIPVTSDDAPVDDPIDPKTADSEKMLEKDEQLAIQEGEIVEGRTRGATKPKGSYAEPGDEEGLPGPDDGTSSVR